MPICPGLSTSLPTPQYFTLCGASKPCSRRNFTRAVSPVPLQYSTQSAASLISPSPQLAHRYGSILNARQNRMNSFVPNWFCSVRFQARSCRAGRLARGPTPSIHRYPEAKLPPGNRTLDMFIFSMAPRISLRSVSLPAFGDSPTSINLNLAAEGPNSMYPPKILRSMSLKMRSGLILIWFIYLLLRN